MVSYTFHCKILAKEYDMNYQIIAFENLDKAPFGYKYCMVIVFPNWESRIPEIGEVGYINYDEVRGGIDTYYDRNLDSIVKYKYDNLIFKKFVKESDNLQKDNIII